MASGKWTAPSYISSLFLKKERVGNFIFFSQFINESSEIYCFYSSIN